MVVSLTAPASNYSAPASTDMQIDPFEKIRARALVGYAILTLIATIIAIAIFTDKPSPLRTALTILLLYVFFSLFAFKLLSRAGLSYGRLCGTFPTWRTLGLYSLWAGPLVTLSIASIYLLYLPLSFLFPEFVQSWLIEHSAPTFWKSGDHYILASLLSLFTTVLIGPVLEEFFFRGILLTRWTTKWGVTWAILVSSTIFALLHVNPIGGFCFGCAMAIFYIRTKSLFVPMCVHIANNAIACVTEFLTMDLDDPTSETLAGFQESWWIGLAGLAISIPFIFQFWRRYISNINWQVPYLSESLNSEENAK